jgi:hypothetical protein
MSMGVPLGDVLLDLLTVASGTFPEAGAPFLNPFLSSVLRLGKNFPDRACLPAAIMSA